MLLLVNIILIMLIMHACLCMRMQGHGLNILCILAMSIMMVRSLWILTMMVILILYLLDGAMAGLFCMNSLEAVL